MVDQNIEPLIVTKENYEEVKEWLVPLGECAVYTIPKPTEENRVNEDSALVLPLKGDCCVLAVSDGMGGHARGAEASSLALQALIEVFHQNNESTDLRASVMAAIEMAHKKIQELKAGAGATLSVAAVERESVRFYNIGDSSSLLVGGKGTLKFKNVEHSPVGYAREAGLLSETEAKNHEESNLIYSALGLDGMRIEVSEKIALSERDSLLIASDGLTSNINEEELYDLLTRGKIKERLGNIVTRANTMMASEQGHADDMTAILFRRG